MIKHIHKYQVSLNTFKTQIRNKQKHAFKRKKIQNLQTLQKLKQLVQNLCQQTSNYQNIQCNLLQINKILVYCNNVFEQANFSSLFTNSNFHKYLLDLFQTLDDHQHYNTDSSILKSQLKLFNNIYDQAILTVSIILRNPQIIYFDLDITHISQSSMQISLIQNLVQSLSGPQLKNKGNYFLSSHILKGVSQILDQLSFQKQETSISKINYKEYLFQTLKSVNFERFIFSEADQCLQNLSHSFNLSQTLDNFQFFQDFSRKQQNFGVMSRLIQISTLIAKYCNFINFSKLKLQSQNKNNLITKIAFNSMQLLSIWKKNSLKLINEQRVNNRITQQQYLVLQNKIQWIFGCHLNDLMKLVFALPNIPQDKVKRISRHCISVLLYPVQYRLININSDQISRQLQKITFQKFVSTQFNSQLFHHLSFLYWLQYLSFAYNLTIDFFFSFSPYSRFKNSQIHQFLCLIDQIQVLQYFQDYKKYFQELFFAILINLINNSQEKQYVAQILIKNMESTGLLIYKKLINLDCFEQLLQNSNDKNEYNSNYQKGSFELQKEKQIICENQKKIDYYRKSKVMLVKFLEEFMGKLQQK